MLQWTIKHLLVLIAFLALVISLFVLQSKLHQKSLELEKLQQKWWRSDVDVGRSEVVIETALVNVQWEIEYSSQNGCTYSLPAGKNEIIAVSVRYVGSVDLKRHFELFENAEKIATYGHLVAVKVSRFDTQLKKTVETETTYTLYTGNEANVYQNGDVSVTIKPLDD